MTNRATNDAGMSTQKVTVLATVSITGSSELGVALPSEREGIDCSMYQRNLFTRPAAPDVWTRVIYMALTFGTLLSSQGADAHRRGSREPFRGNLSHATRSIPRSQTDPLRPASHLVAAHGPVHPGSWRVALGGRPTGPARCSPGSPGGLAAAPCVEQGEH